MTDVAAAEEEPMDGLDALALEMRTEFADMRAEMRAGFAELRASSAETRAGLAEVRAELSEFRLQQGERHTTLIDAIADVRNEYRGHTHGD